MKIFGVIAIALGLMLPVAQASAQAYISAPVLGMWEDQLPSGSKMLVTFTKTDISFQMLNPQGLTSGAATTIPISYSRRPDGIFELKPSGPIGELMEVTINGSDAIIIHFENLPARTLKRKRVRDPALGNGHGQN
jgi:hypothetical protein